MSEKFNPPAPPDGLVGPRIHRASRLLRNRFNEVVNSEGLFSGQHHIIILLKHNDGLTLSEVAKATNVTPATASVSVKRMEKAGFIEKRSDEADARTVRIYLTEKGKSVTDNIKEKMDAQENMLTEGLSKEETLALSCMLDKIIDNMERSEQSD